jgi:hypothetical protein
VATVGKIVAVLTARTAPFSKGMAAAGRKTRAFGAGVAKIGAKIAKFGAALGAVALGGLALIVRSQLKAIDTLAKLSRNLGVATEQLQALRLAASIAGVSGETMDKALKKMTKSVADLNNGLSTQVRAFDALGVSAEELQGLAPDEIFKVLADAVQNTGKSVQTTAAIMDIFGTRIGADLVNLLEQGRAGVESFEQEIRDLGLEMTNVDAAKVEIANDAWTRFKGILTGVAQKITVELAPFISAMINRFVEWGKKGTGVGGVITSSLEFVAKAAAVVANIVHGLKVAFEIWQAVGLTTTNAVIQGFVKLAEGIEWILDKVGILESGWTTRLQMMADASSAFAAQARKDARDAFDELGSDPWGDRVIDTFDRIREQAQKAAEEAGKIREAGEMILPAIEPAVEEVKKLKEEIAQVQGPGGREQTGEFRQVDLATLGLFGKGGKSPATSEVQKWILDTLKEMKEIMADPPPPLEWA